MAQNKLFDLIKTNRLFSQIPAGDVKLNANAKDFLSFQDGDIIFQTGDSADVIFLLIEGEVKIKHSQAVDGQRVFEKNKDDFFGETEFLAQTPRTSSAVANKACKCFLLKRKELNDIITANRAILGNLQRLESSFEREEDYHSTKEHYSDEITNLLKTAETEYSQFGYPDIPNSEGSKDETPIVEKPVEPTKSTKQTFEDSFTFGEDSTFSFANTPDEQPLQESQPTEPENLSWDFTKTLEIEPPKEIKQIEDEKPAEEEPASPESLGINWNFEDIEKSNESSLLQQQSLPEEPAVPAKQEEPPVEGEKFTWDFLTTHEEVAAPEPAKEEKESEFPEWLNNIPETDEPLKEFEFDEHGNLITSKPGEDGDSDFSSAFKDDIPVVEQPAIEDEKTWGNEDYLFAAPLEAKKTVTNNVHDGMSHAQLKLIINATKLVNSNIKLDEILNVIVNAASSITQADRGTLYIVDNEAGELWSKVIRGDNIEEIRLKLGQGLAGWVAKSGEIVNIKDASQDERFDSEIDKHSGYKTKSMLCFPIRNKENQIIAVIQLLNSGNGEFTKLDEDYLEALSAHIAIALENAELVEQLLRTDRLTSIGKVAKFLISDIKKPILTIKQLAEHISKKDISQEIKQVLGMLIDQSNIVIDLVLTTLNYSEGKSAVNKKPTSVNHMMGDLLDPLAEYVKYRKSELYQSLSPADVLVSVDLRELYQAFFQITKNACDAMPQGGSLYVNVSNDNDKVDISFKDSGSGIPAGVLEKVFEPFMSFGKKHGVGLGLPIAEKIIKEHDGKIAITSDLTGTIVTITLPIVK
jgi:signal transduction histidine kinase/CRP-like cAMP-binding protein